MAIHRIRIDYTVYPPNFSPDRDSHWELGTFSKAKRKARGLGIGARVYRNFNETSKGAEIGRWWGDRHFWRWTGSGFERLLDKDRITRVEWT